MHKEFDQAIRDKNKRTKAHTYKLWRAGDRTGF